MFYKVIVRRNKLQEVFDWLGEKSSLLPFPPTAYDRNYSYILLPEQNDYFNQEISTVQFRFQDISVAQEVSDIFSDGSVQELSEE